MRRLLTALLAVYICAVSAQAQTPPPGYGWSVSGQVVTNDMPFITTSNQPTMSNERALTVGSGLTTTDNGANSSFVIGLDSVLSYFHGTGATTQQSAANAILNFPSLTSQDTIKFDGTNWVRLPKGTTGQVLGIDGSGNLSYISPAGSGTVTSVGLTMPAWLTVGGSPVTGSGTLAVSNGTGLTANRVVGTDGSGNLDLMAMTAAQVPSLDASKITTGNLAKACHATTSVHTDQSNTYSGTTTQDFSASTTTLRLPLKTAPGSPAAGEVWVATGAVQVRDNAGVTQTMVPTTRTISAGTGLTGGGDLSANRTLTAANTATTGYTGQTTYATGDMLYASAANTLAKRTIGTTGQVLTVSGGVPVWAGAPSGLYGDGSDGAVTKGAVTETTVIQVNATTFTQSVSTTYAPISRTQIKATSTCDFNGTTNVATGNPGSAAQTATTSTVASRGIGLSGGFSGTSSIQNGGAGGGFGGAGGQGGGGGSAIGSPISQGNDDYWEGPSGGGAGAWVSSGTGGAGGNAGGSFAALSSGALSVGASGTINADGQAGAAGVTGSCGGGGGSGGVICLYSGTSITLNTGSNIFARGGAGGNGAGGQAGGGGGGGGKVVRVAPSITGAGTVTVTGGAAGTGGTPAATAGSTGVNLSITDTPTFMLTQELRKPHIDSLYQYHVAFGDIEPGAELRLPSSRPAAIYCASFYPKEQREAIVHELMFGEDLNGGKVVQIKREDIADAA